MFNKWGENKKNWIKRTQKNKRNPKYGSMIKNLVIDVYDKSFQLNLYKYRVF